MSNWEKYLNDIYLDPSHPASFGSPDRLYKIVKKEGKHKISHSQIKKWIQKQESYSLNKGLKRKFQRGRVVVEGIDDQFDVTGSASASACAVVHYRLITYATYMRVQAPHVHPGTAAVNQTACNFPIKGRAFAIDLHSKPEKPTVNISNRNYKISKTVCSILDPRKALTFHYKF